MCLTCCQMLPGVLQLAPLQLRFALLALALPLVHRRRLTLQQGPELGSLNLQLKGFTVG